ncbi:MAG TPA: hypothetical protein VGS10_17135 [Terracidiphilus sp.]|nr:hypothetical protein [Terracidiphilus sp.]
MPIDRREFLKCAAALPFFTAPAFVLADEPPVAPIDPPKIHPSQFDDADLDMPYALVHFAEVANSILLDGPHRGWISLSVWRGTSNCHWYDARIMENILSLAWFYTAPRPWNPYRGNPELRYRLELALQFWCGIQNDDGRFSEYGPQQWNLAATSFAVKFMSEALRLLKDGPPISPSLHQRAIDCCRKSLRAVLFDPDLYAHGRTYTNQYTNILAGGAAFLDLYPDAELSAQLRKRLEASPTELQSPCGYMYEKDGPDLGYTLNTHHENLQMAYNYWRGTPMGDMLVEEENRFGKWLSYNALPEPGQDFFVLNRSIESRQKHAIYAHVDTPLAERCVIMRAFATPPELRARQIQQAREELVKNWPEVAPLEVGKFEAFGPYRFLQRSNYNWHPTAEQISEAVKLVRPLSESSFVEQLKDTRKPIVFTYVRRPGYYAAFAAAPKPITAQQRLGLTLVWTPSNGGLLQSQTAGRETAWGTSAGGDLPFEAQGLEAEYIDGGAAVHYALPGGGQKRIEFADDRIRVTVESEGDLVERLPVFNTQCISSTAQRSVQPQDESPIPGKSFSVVELRSPGKLQYEIRPV